jgi:hypothetical protein
MMAAVRSQVKTKGHEADIRTIFDSLSNDALLDDGQVALVADVSRPTIKRWRREKKGPRVTMLNGLPQPRRRRPGVAQGGTNVETLPA